MIKSPSIILFIAMHFVLLHSSCSKTDEMPIPNSNQPNILFIIADDLGKDAISGYEEGSTKPNTPNIDAIRNSGLAFNNFWVNPTCTPTRASIITGKYGYRTGVKSVGDILNSTEITLQSHIASKTNGKYATALIGKWHLSGNNANTNPELFGIDYYAGLIRGNVDDYYNWQITEDGATRLQTKYTTEVFTDLAIDWINVQSKPWFLWLAYNAPHTPFHVPPSQMHSQGSLPAYTLGVNPLPYYLAAIEAMDYQVGKLLNTIPVEVRANTIIIFIGDNGTPDQVTQSPYTSSTVKNTLYQGGINVPMFISGKGVSRFGTDNNLLSGTDLFATICELAGINTSSYYDSYSFKSLLTGNDNPVRDYQYSEITNGSNDSWTISNGIYKLLESDNGNEELYNLAIDPYEQTNLLDGSLTLEESNAKIELQTELDKIRQ